MKLALKLLILLSGIVSAVALAALIHVLAGLFFAGPFAEVFNHAAYRDLEHLFHVWAAYSFTAIAIYNLALAHLPKAVWQAVETKLTRSPLLPLTITCA